MTDGWVAVFRGDDGTEFDDDAVIVDRVAANGHVVIHAYVIDRGDIWRRADSYNNFVKVVRR